MLVFGGLERTGEWMDWWWSVNYTILKSKVSLWTFETYYNQPFLQKSWKLNMLRLQRKHYIPALKPQRRHQQKHCLKDSCFGGPASFLVKVVSFGVKQRKKRKSWAGKQKYDQENQEKTFKFIFLNASPFPFLSHPNWTVGRLLPVRKGAGTRILIVSKKHGRPESLYFDFQCSSDLARFDISVSGSVEAFTENQVGKTTHGLATCFMECKKNPLVFDF